MVNRSEGKDSPGWLSAHVGGDQAKDTGMAVVLVLLAAFLLKRFDPLIVSALIALLIDMIWPRFYSPLARIWFGFSLLLGKLMSRLFLTLVFTLILVPVAMARKFSGADPLQSKAWKNGSASVFKIRDHLFTSADIENPY